MMAEFATGTKVWKGLPLAPVVGSVRMSSTGVVSCNKLVAVCNNTGVSETTIGLDDAKVSE